MIELLALTGRGIVRATPQADGSWTDTVALTGVDVRALATSPRRPRTVFAATQDQGVWRSDDGGATWRPVGLADQVVKALAVSPHDPDVVYAGTCPPALHLSRDGGATWTELPAVRRRRDFWWFSPAEPPRLTPYVQAIALSPDDPNVLLVGIELGAVLRSADGGQTWSRHRRRALRDCHSLAFHARDGRWVYEAGGSGGGAAFSRDGGRTWQRPQPGLDRTYGFAVVADPQRPELWYVSASPQPSWRGPWVPPAHIDGQSDAAVYRIEADGRPRRLAGGLPQPLDHFPYALVTDPAAAGCLYVGLVNGEVWVSADYGDHFHPLPVNLGAGLRLLRALPTVG